MKKLFLILLFGISFWGLSQSILGRIDNIFINNATGELVQWTAPQDDSTSRLPGGGEFARCRCYQGHDSAEKNKENNPQGSCCWVHPDNGTFPYCSLGCI